MRPPLGGWGIKRLAAGHVGGELRHGVGGLRGVLVCLVEPRRQRPDELRVGRVVAVEHGGLRRSREVAEPGGRLTGQDGLVRALALDEVGQADLQQLQRVAPVAQAV